MGCRQFQKATGFVDATLAGGPRCLAVLENEPENFGQIEPLDLTEQLLLIRGRDLIPEVEYVALSFLLELGHRHSIGV